MALEEQEDYAAKLFFLLEVQHPGGKNFKANFLAKSNRIMIIYMHFYVEVTTEITVNLQKA